MSTRDEVPPKKPRKYLWPAEASRRGQLTIISVAGVILH